MMIRRRYHQVPVTQCFAILRVRRCVRASGGKQLREDALRRSDVKHDEHRRGKLRGQCRCKVAERFDPADRGADDQIFRRLFSMGNILTTSAVARGNGA